MRHLRAPLLVFVIVIVALAQGPAKLRPGFNLFSKEQDIQLGREAAAEVSKQFTIIRNPRLNAYLERIGKRLASRPEAGGYPYTFSLVHDKNINAFALPGGPTFVHTGLILAAEEEAELAGVMAHEIAHVALRHGTNQVSRANIISIPAALAAAAVGNGSVLAQLGQLGIGVGANSLLLKYSRNAERDADLLGAQILAGAGYDPVAMVRFFEKLEKEGGARGLEFFSSHPNPGNRIKAVEREVQYLPRNKGAETGQFQRMKQLVRALGDPPAPKAQSQSR